MKLKIKGKCNLCNQATDACYRAEIDKKEKSIKCNTFLEADDSKMLTFFTIFTTGTNLLSDFELDANGEVPTFLFCENGER